MTKNIIRSSRSNQQGFTLIELLAVILFIGALAAFAVHKFLAHKQRAYDALAQSDLYSAMLAEETYYADYQRYATCTDRTDCASVLPGFIPSQGVEISITTRSNDQLFNGEAAHPGGTKNYYYDSETGRSSSS